MPKVSIIIPCFNQEEYLKEALQELQSQTLQDFECIIVDDGSTDSSAEIAEQFCRKDARYRLIKKSNGGTASARNAGLSVAQGEYIQFLDADDYLHSEKLKHQICLMEENKWDVSYTEYAHFKDLNGKRIMVPHISLTTQVTFSMLFTLLTRYGVDFSVPPLAFLYRHDFLTSHRIRFTEEIRFREDWDFILNIFALPSVRWGSDRSYVGAYYRQNPQGKTSSAYKLSDGNMRYIVFKAQRLPVLYLIPWAFRLSCEFTLITGRAVKHHSMSAFKPIGRLCESLSIRTAYITLLTIIMLPLCILYVLLRSLLVYTDRMRSQKS